MPCQNYTILEEKDKTKTLASSIKNEERIVLGCKALKWNNNIKLNGIIVGVYI